MTSEIWGMTPEHCTLRTNTSPYAPSETTPSWMRAPPESLMPMTGQPIFAARSMTLPIFSPMTSPSQPPKTVKSWEKTHTGRPSIVPWPVTTASPQGRFLSISKSCVRWRTNVSSSWNEPGSSSLSMRSRAVSLPRSCCFSTAASEPAWAASRSSLSCSTFSSYVSGFLARLISGRASYPSALALLPYEGLLVRRAEVVEQAAEALLEVLVAPRLRRRGRRALLEQAPEEAVVGHLRLVLLDPRREGDLRAPARRL